MTCNNIQCIVILLSRTVVGVVYCKLSVLFEISEYLQNDYIFNQVQLCDVDLSYERFVLSSQRVYKSPWIYSALAPYVLAENFDIIIASISKWHNQKNHVPYGVHFLNC